MTKLPKWAQKTIREVYELPSYTDAESMIDELRAVPPYAEISVEEDYGSTKIVAEWYRDMNDREFEKEKRLRTLAAQKKKDDRARIEEMQYKDYLRLKKKFEGD